MADVEYTLLVGGKSATGVVGVFALGRYSRAKFQTRNQVVSRGTS